MAVDTRNKRASVIALALAFKWLAPNPDGALDSVGEREQSVRLYAGGYTVTATPLVPRIILAASGFSRSIAPSETGGTIVPSGPSTTRSA